MPSDRLRVVDRAATPAGWTWPRAAAVAAGGASGAGCRWAALSVAGSHQVPWPVLAVNVVGSFLLGVLLAEEPGHPSSRLALHDLGAIGFCGGLTTFSTFAVEIVDLIERDDALLAATYGAASLAAAIVALVAGAALLHRVRALSLPVEEEP